jgi:hypothetical protein
MKTTAQQKTKEQRAWELAKIALGPDATAEALMTRTLQILEVL